METKNPILNLRNFYFLLTGLIVGALSFYVYDLQFRVAPHPDLECNVSGVSEINNKSAKEFYTAYQSVNRDSTWAINVSFEQLHLLNKTYQDLGSSAADHSGIRLYYGLNPAAPSGPIRVLAFPLGDQSPTPIADLSIDPVNYIDLSMDIYRQPCPYFCD